MIGLTPPSCSAFRRDTARDPVQLPCYLHSRIVAMIAVGQRPDRLRHPRRKTGCVAPLRVIRRDPAGCSTAGILQTRLRGSMSSGLNRLSGGDQLRSTSVRPRPSGHRQRVPTRTRYRDRVIQASSTATIPVMKIPSKVPAPPMETRGAPRRGTSLSRRMSAPMSTPSVPQT
jgi:hypothetical protein